MIYIHLVPRICTCDAPKVDSPRLAGFTIEFAKILPTSADIAAIRRKSAEERTRVDSKRLGVQRGDIEEYNLVKARLAAARAPKGLRNGQSGFMATLNPNERSFLPSLPPPPPSEFSPTNLSPSWRLPSIENVVFVRLLPLGVRFRSSWENREDFTTQIAKNSATFLPNSMRKESRDFMFKCSLFPKSGREKLSYLYRKKVEMIPSNKYNNCRKIRVRREDYFFYKYQILFYVF